MGESYFSLSDEDKASLLRLRADELGMRPFLVEKDIWVCWTLDKLFNMPDRLTMAFKGGTSLSKVYSVIDRFSEDVDVTIDYRSLREPLSGTESRAAITRLSDDLKTKVQEYSQRKVKPYFEKVVTEEIGAQNCLVEVSENGEQIFVHYPSVLADKSDYLKSSVLIEFGGRNITEPNDIATVRPYIAQVEKDIKFPESEVTVLALERTYWEKATLIHVEIHRPNSRESADRMSRHWYDMHQLSKKLDRFQTSEAHRVLGSVVEHKKVFFHYGYANYDACLTGGLKLVPQGELRTVLERDFAAMVQAGMFYTDPPPFAEIIDRLAQTEQQLNDTIKSKYKKSAST